MTPTSLLPQEAKAIGIDFEDLCELIIDISLKNIINKTRDNHEKYDFVKYSKSLPG